MFSTLESVASDTGYDGSADLVPPQSAVYGNVHLETLLSQTKLVSELVLKSIVSQGDRQV